MKCFPTSRVQFSTLVRLLRQNLTVNHVFMLLQPKQQLSEKEVQQGLKWVIGDGLATEAMISLTSGTFLIAMALLMGANNLQIGIISALPMFSNIFQLLSIWLVRRFNNRRAICVICALAARICLAFMGVVILLTSQAINMIILFLFFYYFFGAVAGPSWNAWMKDLVPEESLGTYFAKRTRYMQILNVCLSFLFAGVIDYIKRTYALYELPAYALIFLGAGIVGVIGAFILARAPEPTGYMSKENMFRLFKKPLQDSNFLHLLIFNAAWVFALNIATPFFTVYMMKSLGLPLSYIIGLSIVSQLCNIFSLSMWGTFSDRYSNKTIIAIAAPMYILCVLAWCFAGIFTYQYANIILLLFIHIFVGISLSGINLSLVNIGLKLAPREDAIVYLSVNNVFNAVFSSISPLAGGLLADYFTNRRLDINVTWTGPHHSQLFHVVALNEWNFLFLISAVLLFIAVELLVQVKETGEMEKEKVRKIMRKSIKRDLKEYFIIGNIIDLHEYMRDIIRRKAF